MVPMSIMYQRSMAVLFTFCPLVHPKRAVLWYVADSICSLSSTTCPIASSSQLTHMASLLKMRFLSSKEADIDQLHEDKTPLACAILEAKDDMATCLVTLGADVNASVCNERRVLQLLLSRKTGNPQERNRLVNLLLDAGADVATPVRLSNGKLGTILDSYHAALKAATSSHETDVTEEPDEEVMSRVRSSMRSSMSDDFASRRSTQLQNVCYECGLTLTAKLFPCRRCQAVFFCSDRCKLKALTSHHRGCQAVSRGFNLFSQSTELRWRPQDGLTERPSTCPPAFHAEPTNHGIDVFPAEDDVMTLSSSGGFRVVRPGLGIPRSRTQRLTMRVASANNKSTLPSVNHKPQRAEQTALARAFRAQSTSRPQSAQFSSPSRPQSAPWSNPSRPDSAQSRF
eukprot:m.30263 g.30263  ORF g.30263 m.30263 type:complete len:399 (+) comp5194_c0_seq1:1885-3081(+)